jgi:hypothetical protein
VQLTGEFDTFKDRLASECDSASVFLHHDDRAVMTILNLV